MVVVASAVWIGGCSIIPPTLDDTSLPVREILQHTACELRYAFVKLSEPQYASFKANKWLVAIKLSPKTDSEINGGVGSTGKSTTLSAARYFNSWALGSVGAPGGAVDAKGTRDVSITFKTSSKELISNPRNQLICPVDSPRAHVLTEHLGIGEWLVRLVEAKDTAMGSLAKLDSPTYSSQIFVKFGGNGSFTYTFPFGAAFGALSGSYDMDETLLITLSPDTTSSGTLVVQTLPVGGNFKDGPDRVTVISRVNAQEKLDTTTNQQSIINAIRNLPR
ncbi:hypothetical protein J4G43_050675 [Bradyrhizobium barranii subsp. barranii]|uniref:Uncharacterized protein n=1 Tax=Bradyrhizobium barranii subsp. barranii TaxID=2823807 RepID=A0A939LYL1_9BRAD|nr:hypothetical protein [Bradyrhizobium barranii]UEM12558.1 hypothetical protein J4G43_050675 [Bradyrhizobium barranii subsp. barranii]